MPVPATQHRLGAHKTKGIAREQEREEIAGQLDADGHVGLAGKFPERDAPQRITDVITALFLDTHFAHRAKKFVQRVDTCSAKRQHERAQRIIHIRL